MSALSINPLKHPQLKADLSVVDKFLSDSKKDKIKRAASFTAANPNNVVIQVAGGAFGGAVLGAALGAAAFGLPTLAIAPPMAPTAAKAGALIGAAALGAAVAKYEYQIVEFPQEFARWKKDAVAKSVYPIFEKYVGEAADDFKCPYTTSLISNPVKDMHGCVFEREELAKDFQIRGERMTCIKTTRPITGEDILPDLDYHSRLLAKIKPIFDKNVKDAGIVAGVLALESQVENIKIEETVSKVRGLVGFLNKAKTKEEQQEILKQIMSELGNTPLDCSKPVEDVPATTAPTIGIKDNNFDKSKDSKID